MGDSGGFCGNHHRSDCHVYRQDRRPLCKKRRQKEISEIFLGFTRSLQQGILVSPTIVRVSPDLSVARVYISVFPTNKEQEILDLMNEKSVSIRHDLAQRTRHQLRTVPTLTFFLDDSLDYLENIDQLLKG